MVIRFSFVLIFFILIAGQGQAAESEQELEFYNQADVFHGERLFLETRFAQRFYQFINNGGSINENIDIGDPKLEKTVRFFGLPPYQIPFATGPFKGMSYNCRTCHLVDEHLTQRELGMRTYSDFASRSPLPSRADGREVTSRNSPGLVGISSHRKNYILHLDGEFSSLKQVVRETLTGRNLGWLPNEYELAKKHICKIIREENGQGELAKDFGNLSYQEVYSGTKKNGSLVSDGYLISENLRLNVIKASCDKILDLTSSLISAYISDLAFSKEEDILSPYDVFLIKNKLPRIPKDGESALSYSSRLLMLIEELLDKDSLIYVNKNPNTDSGEFRFHDQPFEFGENTT